MNTSWTNQFRNWRAPDVQRAFGLTQDYSGELLRSWIATQHPIPATYTELLERLRYDLLRLHPGWNETELMGRFIAPLLAAIGFDGPGYSLFFERPLSLELPDGKRVAGTVYALVAAGDYEPLQPYFFLHEFKRSHGSEADPQGQLLVALAVAQRLNTSAAPLYGCYVVGKFWHFVWLEGSVYGLTQGYDASDAGELALIWSLLAETKQRIARQASPHPST